MTSIYNIHKILLKISMSRILKRYAEAGGNERTLRKRLALIGVQAGTGFLFPIEGTWQYTFGTGHYSFSDCIKGNWPITVVGMLCCVILIPILMIFYQGIGLIG